MGWMCGQVEKCVDLSEALKLKPDRSSSLLWFIVVAAPLLAVLCCLGASLHMKVACCKPHGMKVLQKRESNRQARLKLLGAGYTTMVTAAAAAAASNAASLPHALSLSPCRSFACLTLVSPPPGDRRRRRLHGRLPRRPGSGRQRRTGGEGEGRSGGGKDTMHYIRRVFELLSCPSQRLSLRTVQAPRPSSPADGPEDEARPAVPTAATPPRAP